MAILQVHMQREVSDFLIRSPSLASSFNYPLLVSPVTGPDRLLSTCWVRASCLGWGYRGLPHYPSPRGDFPRRSCYRLSGVGPGPCHLSTLAVSRPLLTGQSPPVVTMTALGLHQNLGLHLGVHVPFRILTRARIFLPSDRLSLCEVFGKK